MRSPLHQDSEKTRLSVKEIIQKFKAQQMVKSDIKSNQAIPQIKLPIKISRAPQTKDEEITKLREDLEKIKLPTEERPYPIFSKEEDDNLEFTEGLRELKEKIKYEDSKLDSLIESLSKDKTTNLLENDENVR